MKLRPLETCQGVERKYLTAGNELIETKEKSEEGINATFTFFTILIGGQMEGDKGMGDLSGRDEAPSREEKGTAERKGS